ncbi:MAG: bifunctional pyr operon transcriptional regulator/uracil phosphoribosyltransferase PyrR [Chromatiales bacterium]|jgi:pyrimidine operon attenuation protein/uracil phosphoribosyltransferase|nr:bifunctional pyr operon transcriptional regulator/uracil phosphoribosyltransferase PyrR [Chromatiales bacterium]
MSLDPSTIDIDTELEGMANRLRVLLEERAIADPLMVGIYTGGAWVAARLHSLLGLTEPLGMLDISFYRDDFTRVGINPQVRPSHLPVSIDERHLVLVDDVLGTGRTIRAALNEIFDYGRPASIMLATLVERGGRELPIQADVVGLNVKLTRHQHIKLHGPTPLRLSIVEPPQKG